MNFEDFVIATNTAETPEEVYQLLIDVLEGFGYDRTLYSFLTPHKELSIQAGHGIVRSYPESWMEHYFARDYYSIDPVITECFRTNRPFLWDELPMDTLQKRMMDESKEATLFDGVGLPIHGMNREVAAFGIASSSGKVETPPHVLSLIHAYVFQFHQAYTDKLANLEKPAVDLTKKEREVLSWMAEGKTLQEIGDIMCLSEDTIRYYLKGLYRKLGANQRTLAVVKAIRLGLINPYRLEA